MSRRSPQVGDRAHHRGGLDSRTVTRVGYIPGDRKKYVGLQIGTVEAWPCAASNYTFEAPKPGLEYLT